MPVSPAPGLLGPPAPGADSESDGQRQQRSPAVAGHLGLQDPGLAESDSRDPPSPSPRPSCSIMGSFKMLIPSESAQWPEGEGGSSLSGVTNEAGPRKRKGSSSSMMEPPDVPRVINDPSSSIIFYRI